MMRRTAETIGTAGGHTGRFFLLFFGFFLSFSFSLFLPPSLFQEHQKLHQHLFIEICSVFVYCADDLICRTLWGFPGIFEVFHLLCFSFLFLPPPPSLPFLELFWDNWWYLLQIQPDSLELFEILQHFFSVSVGVWWRLLAFWAYYLFSLFPQFLLLFFRRDYSGFFEIHLDSWEFAWFPLKAINSSILIFLRSKLFIYLSISFDSYSRPSRTLPGIARLFEMLSFV